MGELSGVLRFVEPGDGLGVSAFVAERFLKGPEVGPVPDDEFAVVVHVVGDGLVHLDEVFVAVRGAREALGRGAEEALHSVDELLLVRVVCAVSFATGTGVAAGRSTRKSFEVGF